MVACRGAVALVGTQGPCRQCRARHSRGRRMGPPSRRSWPPVSGPPCVARARSGGRPGSGDVRPNVLGRAATPNTFSVSPAAGPAGVDRAPSSASRRFIGAVRGTRTGRPAHGPQKSVVAVAEQTPCETVEVLLADGAPETLDARARRLDARQAGRPAMTPRAHRPMTLEIARAASPEPRRIPGRARPRRLPRRPRAILGEHRDHVEFEAQRFATTDGATAFQAFANRYACQFATRGLPRAAWLRWATDPLRQRQADR